MKIKEFINEETVGWRKASPIIKHMIETINQLQIDNEMLMANYEATKLKVASNEAYVEKPKYHVPWGDFKTYSAAGRANSEPISWVEIRRRIKSDLEMYREYYLNV